MTMPFLLLLVAGLLLVALVGGIGLGWLLARDGLGPRSSAPGRFHDVFDPHR